MAQIFRDEPVSKGDDAMKRDTLAVLSYIELKRPCERNEKNWMYDSDITYIHIISQIQQSPEPSVPTLLKPTSPS